MNYSLCMWILNVEWWMLNDYPNWIDTPNLMGLSINRKEMKAGVIDVNGKSIGD